MQSDRPGVLVVGLGNMGGAIAGHLARIGWQVHAFDLNPDAVERAVGHGARAVTSLAEAFGEVGYLVTSLPDPKAVRSAYLGPQGLAELIGANTVVVEMSTLDPATMREVADACRKRPGVRVLDVPVSGGVEEASRGELSLMVGGAQEDVESAQHLLTAMGTVRPAGEVGEAKVVKLINNYVAISNILIAAEALAIADALGVEKSRLYSVLSQSGAQSYQFNKRVPRALDGDYAARFSLALATKDLRLLEAIITEQPGLELPAADAVFQRFEAALAGGLGAEDMLAIAKTYQR